MVNLQNRNRILKPVNESSHSSYGRLDINNIAGGTSTKAGTAAGANSLINNGLTITENGTGSSSGKLVKSTERLEKYTGGGSKNKFQEAPHIDRNARKSYMMSPDSGHHGEIKRKQTFTSSVDLKSNGL